MDLFDIIKICKGKYLGNKKNISYNNFCIDTRNISNGDIFVGIKGEKFNGNYFYKEAFINGASLCILDDDTRIYDEDNHKDIILVENSITAILNLAKYVRDSKNIPVIGITGSVGKTSVKDMVSAVLMSEYNVCYTKGNFNNNIGVPLTILSLRDHDALVVEMGMNHFEELHELSMIAKPTISLITNIGTAHIGNLGSRENILKAKLEILDGMDNGMLIINNDNDMLRTVKYNNLVTVGIDNDSDYMARDIKDLVFSSNFYINNDYIELPVGSRAFIYNALFAYAVGIKLGVSKENIINSLKKFKLTNHRLELVKLNNITLIDDTYNASLDSVKNSLELLSKVKTRRIFIFGDILELDDYSKDIHEEIGNLVINNHIDILICVGNNSKYTFDVANNGNIISYYYKNNIDLINNILNIISNDDTILIKGSHGMNLLEIVEYLKKAYHND